MHHSSVAATSGHDNAFRRRQLFLVLVGWWYVNGDGVLKRLACFLTAMAIFGSTVTGPLTNTCSCRVQRVAGGGARGQHAGRR